MCVMCACDLCVICMCVKIRNLFFSSASPHMLTPHNPSSTSPTFTSLFARLADPHPSLSAHFASPDQLPQLVQNFQDPRRQEDRHQQYGRLGSGSGLELRLRLRLRLGLGLGLALGLGLGIQDPRRQEDRRQQHGRLGLGSGLGPRLGLELGSRLALELGLGLPVAVNNMVG